MNYNNFRMDDLLKIDIQYRTSENKYEKKSRGDLHD